ncbi:hypothetical protein [uncultured Parasphingopyxis sp.]|uniref:DUF4350 domain-containing protein n=1 Tax=uncultured Parasphingopyxis sp. TaxID=1547918 RepID=UPI00261925F1|nr:hypothetical protein [uncultured Parasphingopyxis sp.]
MSESGASPFSTKSVLIIVVALIVGFLAFMLLLAYAPGLKSGENGGAHGLSRSAVGFRGLHDLLEETGLDVSYARDPEGGTSYGLTIVTPQFDSDPERIDQLIEEGGYSPTLIILPKWSTMQAGLDRDEVAAIGTGMAASVLPLLSDLGKLQVTGSDTREGATLVAPDFDARYAAPASLQVMTGDRIEPVIATPGGDIVLGYVTGTETYILSEPDLLNNQVLSSAERARAALTLIDTLNYEGGPISFDLVANGFGESANLLVLMFEPPFLALTLCMLAAALLAGWQAFNRFGPARREPRAIAFGKRALVDNSAELLKLARREHLSAENYVGLTRDTAVAAIGNPRGLSGPELDNWLDGLKKDGPSFTSLAARAHRARSRQDILDAAQALYQWRKAVTHEG